MWTETGWGTGEFHEECYGNESRSILWSHGDISPTNSCRSRCLNQANPAIQFADLQTMIWHVVHPSTSMELVAARIERDSWNLMICIFYRGTYVKINQNGNWACSKQNGAPNGLRILRIASIFGFLKYCMSRIEAIYWSVAAQKEISSWGQAIAERRSGFIWPISVRI
jgi:hypothetical protein